MTQLSPSDPDDTVVDPRVLAERRARRAEISEDALRARATQAEQSVVRLEQRLADATAERERLASRIIEVERELTAARQREFSEQQARVEAESEAGSARRESRREAARLRKALEAAQARAAELAAEIEPLRVALRGARGEADIELLAQEVERRDHAVAALEAELERRVALEADVQRAVVLLRDELETVRVEQEGQRARETELETLVTDLIGTADGLRDAFTRELENERAARAALEAELERERELRAALETELAALRVRRPAPAVPPADHPALATQPSPAPEADDLIAELGRAAARLRADTASVAGATGAPPDAILAVEQLAPLADPLPAGAEPTARRLASPARAAVPLPRVTEIGRRASGLRASSWLTPALRALAAADPAAAARIILACAPVQAARLRRTLVYDLVLTGHGTSRVALAADGSVRVEPALLGDALAPPDFRIGAAPAVAAVLAGGGASRRLPDAQIAGRKRHARRLLRALAAPVGFAELAASGVALDAGDALALLACAVPSYATAAGSLAFAIGDEPYPALVADGAGPVVRRLAAGDADAVAHPAPGELLAVLAGAAAVPVTGDVDTARAVLALIDGAQR